MDVVLFRLIQNPLWINLLFNSVQENKQAAHRGRVCQHYKASVRKFKALFKRQTWLGAKPDTAELVRAASHPECQVMHSVVMRNQARQC